MGYMFYVLLGRTFMFGLRTKKALKLFKTFKTLKKTFKNLF